MAEQAKILFAEAEENNLGHKAVSERWGRWHKCSLCEQDYHGAVYCALGWACWKTYLGRPDTDWTRQGAMSMLGNGLLAAESFTDALPVYEAVLAMMRRLGASDDHMLAVQNNLAATYQFLKRHEKALSMYRQVYSAFVKLHGEDQPRSLDAANNYAVTLTQSNRYREAKSLLRKLIPVVRRVLGDSNELTLQMRWNYAKALYEDTDATLDDIREAVTTLEETERTARRVLGGTHPTTEGIEDELRTARAVLRAREAGKRVVFKFTT